MERSSVVPKGGSFSSHVLQTAHKPRLSTDLITLTVLSMLLQIDCGNQTVRLLAVGTS